MELSIKLILWHWAFFSRSRDVVLLLDVSFTFCCLLRGFLIHRPSHVPFYSSYVEEIEFSFRRRGKLNAEVILIRWQNNFQSLYTRMYTCIVNKGYVERRCRWNGAYTCANSMYLQLHLQPTYTPDTLLRTRPESIDESFCCFFEQLISFVRNFVRFCELNHCHSYSGLYLSYPFQRDEESIGER